MKEKNYLLHAYWGHFVLLRPDNLQFTPHALIRF
jgi:hypothetical protein